MASVRSIAKRAGVSTATVSRVLNNDPVVAPDTRSRVLAVANEGGYANTRGRRRTLRIGFAYTQELTINHPYDAAVLGGVVRAAADQEADVVILGLDRDKMRDESYTRYFHRKGIDGVILRTMAATRDVCMAIAEEEFPHVVVSERFDSPKVNYIGGASGDETRRAVDYLISIGHERIAFGMHNVADRDHLDRLEGYKAALAEHGIKTDEKLIIRQRYTLAGGATLLKLVLSMPDRPTALVLADPLLSLGAVREARASRVQIPDDLSIVGFDDTDIRFGVYPTLSAICQDAEGLGAEAGRWLLERIATPGIAGLRREVSTFFEINDSTAAPTTHNGRNGHRAARIVSETDDARGTNARVVGGSS